MLPTLSKFKSLPANVKQYLLVTGNYWVFTLTDGALRMLVVLHFHQLGYTPLQIAMLFLFYEFFGVITNLFGGWLGAHLGLNKTMNIGLLMQVVALSMLLVPSSFLSVTWVMLAQALSGIAKDLNKMSAKSSVKILIGSEQDDRLYKWVARLTGSKNTLKGAGFFLGASLLSALGFQMAIFSMAVSLFAVWIISMLLLKADLGKATHKPKVSELLSKSPAINALSAARLFLFAARDVWFVVALPVYLSTQLHWQHWQVGSFIAIWIVIYGLVQGIAPSITGRLSGKTPGGRSISLWTASIGLVMLLLAFSMTQGSYQQEILLTGLIAFGALFAINSSLHSFLILKYASNDGVSLDVGFYYMANAMGRLFGTVLSGWIYQSFGLISCLWVSSAMLLLSAIISLALPKE